MIDLHCHVLPDIDDGASSLDMSRRMLEAMRALGFDRVAATPHLPAALTPSYQKDVAEAFGAVTGIAADYGITLNAGFEIRLHPDLPLRLRQGEPSALAGTSVLLLDLPSGTWPYWVEQTLFDLQVAGYQPILAHPERYPRIQNEPEHCLALAERGIALQVTIGSLAGIFGRRTERTAEALLRLGAVHLVATDAHSVGDRLAAVPKGLRELSKLVGTDGLRRLTVDGPAMLLDRGMLPEPVAAATTTNGQRMRRVASWFGL